MRRIVNFFQHDPKAVLVLFMVLAVLSVTTIVGLRGINSAVKNTDLIAECSTPGTRCAKLSEANRLRNEKFFTDLITKANRCLLESAFVGSANIEQRIAAYDQCIARIPPIPPAAEK